MPFPTPIRRAVATLLCLSLVLPAQAWRTTPLWPEPQLGEPTRPNFNAPSALDCRRPVQARVVPGDRRGQVAADSASIPMTYAPVATPLPVPAPMVTAPAAMRAEAAKLSERAAVAAESRIASPTPAPQRTESPQASSVVTAGVVDDNADFNEYLAFRARTQVEHRERDVRERYLLEVKNAAGHAVPDAEVAVRATDGESMWARTDTAGRVWLHPDAFDKSHAATYDITVRKSGQEVSTQLRRGQKSAVEVRLDAQPVYPRARLDLVFLVDATGSMGDEIDKLRSSLQTIVNKIAQAPSRPDLCLGLVAYRDRVDEFLIKSHDLSNDVPGFQRALNGLKADGGGDYPEAMNEALADTVQRISWRGEGSTRLVILLADAPPHLDYGGTQYDESMMAALGKGIKIFSVGASGLDKQGEYIQRQIAQYTGGRFVFLTYADASRPESGPGRETVHDVNNYSVDTLDKLIVRLVTQELAALK
ncbi:MAG TPA: VWA domain-containing protein [Burkholderiaceae bacterium]|jgi:Mg-chelatase subunit ChlD